MYIEIASLLTDGLICLCRSTRGISLKLRLFYSQLELLVGALMTVSDTKLLN